MITVATSDEFSRLEDPYTGARLTVCMKATPEGPLFYSPDATSPRDPPAWFAGRHSMCLYTGAPFAVRDIGGRTVLLGGFDPRVPIPRESFLHYIAMRGGSSPYPLSGGPRVEATLRTGKVTARQKAHAERNAPKLTDYHVHAVEKSLSRFKDRLPGSSTVSMFTGRRP